MATIDYQIIKYIYSFNALSGEPTELQLLTGGQKAVFALMDETSALPLPTISVDLTSVTAGLRRSALPGLIDMLRYEPSVLIRITTNDASPPSVVDLIVVAEGRIGQGER